MSPSIYRALKKDIIIISGTDSIQSVGETSKKSLGLYFDPQTHPCYFIRYLYGIQPEKNSRPKDLLVPLEQNILGAEGNKVGVHIRAKMLLLFFLACVFFMAVEKK